MKINTLRRSVLLTVFAASAVALGACSGTPEVKPPVTVASPSPAVSPSASPSAVDPKNPVAMAPGSDKKVDALVGRWPGVEGTYLNVAKKGDKYSIEVKRGDKAETFEGTAKGDTIEFTRKGKTETLKAATAEETGMKWPAGEKTCVVITKGSEGYCRK